MSFKATAVAIWHLFNAASLHPLLETPGADDISNQALQLLVVLQSRFHCGKSRIRHQLFTVQGNADLLKVYCSYSRPLIEYAFSLWDTAKAKRGTESLENLRRRALCICNVSSVSLSTLRSH